jgi:kinesin family protein 11
VNELFTDSQRVLEETSQELSTTKGKLCSTRMDLATTKQDLHLTKQERDEKGFLIEEHAKTEDNLHEKATQVSTYYPRYTCIA